MPEVTPAGELAPAPVVEEKPAPVAEEKKTEQPAATEANAEPEETTEQQEAKKQSKFQRRLERQKTARIQAETRAEIAEKRLAELEAQSKPQPKEGEPKREDFQDYEAYLRAVAKYDAKQETAATLKAEREARQGKEKQGTEAVRNEKLAKDWNEREKTFQTATKDYEEVVAPFVDDELQSFSQQARMAIVESEVGPNLLYHLATHPEEAERIAGLSPVRQIAELGKLEVKASAPPKKTTNAPAPITPVNGGKTASKDIAKMTHEEYRAYRKAQGARWAN